MTSAVEFEQQLLEAIKQKTDSNVSFEQKADKDLDFGMSTQTLKSSFSKPIITMAIGSASSGLIAGAVASAIPVNMQFFAGLPTIIAGMLGRMVVKNNATGKDFFTGVVIAGISQAVSRFIPATFGQELSQEVKEKFKQENKPCNSIQEMRSDVAW